MERNASRAFSGCVSTTVRAAPAWTAITLTLCVTTSWISRAMRARSSMAPRRACSSRSRSARSARSRSSSAWRLRYRVLSPTIHAPPRNANWVARSAKSLPSSEMLKTTRAISVRIPPATARDLRA